MRRIVMALFAMVTGTTLLVGLKSESLGVPFGHVADEPLDPGVGDALGPPDGDAVATPGAVDTPGGLDPTATAGPAATTSATPPTGGPTATGGQTSTAPPATTNPPSGTSGTFTGAAVAVKTAQSPNTKPGPCGDCHNYSMSVTITVSNGKITKATVSYNTSLGDSQRYADKATNTLSPKIVTAQTWRLANVSGATYSANAFELSAKDAMTKAGLPT